MASRRHAWLLVGMLLLLLTGCGRLDPIPRPTANSPFAQPSASASPTLRSVRRPAPIRIGAVLSLTGVGAGLGTSQKNALQLAVDELNAPLPADSSLRMELRIEDDGSDRARGVAAVQKLMEVDRVVALFGPTLSSIASAADPLAEQAGVPVLAISNTAGGLTQIGSNIFRVSLPEADLIDAAIGSVKAATRAKRAAIVYDQEEMANRAGLELFRKSLTEHGLTVTGAAGFARGSKDFSAQIASIKAAKPEVLCVAAFGPDASLLVSQIREAGLRDLPIIGGAGLSGPLFLRDAGPAADGVVVGAAWTPLDTQPRNQKFVDAYRLRFNADPDAIAAQAYAGAQLLSESLRQARPPIRRNVRDALAKLGKVETVLGPFSFTATREPRHTPAVLVVREGRFVPYR